MIPIEILKRVGRKAKSVLDPTPGAASPSQAAPAPSPAPSTPTPMPTPPRPAVFDKYTQPGDLGDLGVLFMPLAKYHGQELGAIAEALAELGHNSSFIVQESLVEVVDEHLGDHPRILAEDNFDRFAIGRFDAFVAMNDWGNPSREIYHLARTREVPSFAKVEGVQDFTDIDTGRIRLPYLAADHVLVQGSNDIASLDRKRLHVVGNSNLETAWNEGPSPVERNGEVVINSNFTYGVLLEARDGFLRGAVEAILSAGLTPVISQHPADRPLPSEFAQYRTNKSMSSLLPVVEAVITRFSTIPFEAIAYGTPFVYFNPHFEKVPTFATPDPAFDHIYDPADLAPAISFAVGNRASYRTVAEPYFRAQIDIGDVPSAMRSAMAIASVVYDAPPTKSE